MEVVRFRSLPGERLDALVTTRNGGVSREPYASLNLSLRVGDDPLAVLENRRRLFDAYGLPLERSVWCKQVHNNAVTVVDDEMVEVRADGRRDLGGLDEDSMVAATDALVTALVGVPLCVSLADCVPVVIYDPTNHAVGLAHAGWGGTVARIASRTVEVMGATYGTDPGDVIAAIGPSIAPDRYEVGGDVIEAAHKGFGDDAGRLLKDLPDGKALFDLWEANRIDLQSVGVPDSKIEVSGISTIDDLDRFYSHRAQGPTGRLAGIAMLRDRV